MHGHDSLMNLSTCRGDSGRHGCAFSVAHPAGVAGSFLRADPICHDSSPMAQVGLPKKKEKWRKLPRTPAVAALYKSSGGILRGCFSMIVEIICLMKSKCPKRALRAGRDLPCAARCFHTFTCTCCSWHDRSHVGDEPTFAARLGVSLSARQGICLSNKHEYIVKATSKTADLQKSLSYVSIEV